MKRLHFFFITSFFLILSFNATIVTAQAVPETNDNASKILKRLKNPSKDYILAVSHRGDWRFAPENSLAAVQRCIDLGIDIVEIDVRLTKDGHLVAMHDETVDRTTNGKGKLSDLTLAQVKELRLRNACGIQGSRHGIPTLEEIMLLAKGKIMVNLDKTEGKTVREAYAVLVKTGTVDHGIFKGNDPVEIMREKYGSLMDSIVYMPKVWYNLPDIPTYVKDYNKDLAPVGYEMLFDQTSSPVFAEVKNMNKDGLTVLAVALWDELCAGHTDELALIESPDAAWGWLIQNGANAIMTDYPDLLIKYLQEKGLHD